MGIEDKDQYYVAVKVFLEDNGKLFIFKDKFDQWDLPGGRIKVDEFNTPLESVVKRKMIEEIGDKVQYNLDKPEVFMRHERVEHIEGSPKIRIFAVGYLADFKGGEIELRSHHTEMKWIDIKTFKPEDYFKGGWLKGVQEYLEMKRK